MLTAFPLDPETLLAGINKCNDYLACGKGQADSSCGLTSVVPQTDVPAALLCWSTGTVMRTHLPKQYNITNQLSLIDVKKCNKD